MYTDGSSYGNPGPSGAGVAVYDAEGGVQCLISRALGAGTNNSAELAAILAATDYLLEESEGMAGGPITICRQQDGHGRCAWACRALLGR